MQNSKWSVVLLVGLVLLALGAHRDPAARAAGGKAAAGDGGLIAITGFTRSGVETLFVIDPQRQRLAAYEMTHKGLALVSVRKIAYDMELISYRDGSAKEVSLKQIRKRMAEARRGDRDSSKPRKP